MIARLINLSLSYILHFNISMITFFVQQICYASLGSIVDQFTCGNRLDAQTETLMVLISVLLCNLEY
jgi:hypothetical protein